MIGYVFDVLIIFTLFILFGYSHSFLASRKVKQKAATRFGEAMAFYRLTYNIISLITLIVLYEIVPKPDPVIYDLANPYDILILIPQFLALAGFIYSLRYFCVKEFLGINQIKRWYNNNYLVNELDEQLTLRIDGPYKYSRHPVYFFSIMFLLFRPTMDLFYATIFICFVIYFYIGSVYEEKKLVEVFGDEYKIYREKVPRIFPVKIFKPYTP